MKHRLLAALLALGAVACQRDREDAGRVRASVRDSAGIRIVENPLPPEGSRLGWRIGPEPAMSIGELEGEEPYILHWINAAAKLPDGRIVVANRGSNELRIFNASGIHLASWGGGGEGPGEFDILQHAAPWPGDSIVAWFSHGLGISVFDSDGNFGRSFSLPYAGGPWPRPVAARGNGTILTITEAASNTTVIEIWKGDGTPSASLGTHVGMYETIVTASGAIDPVIYGRELAVGLWGDLVVASPTTRYEIRAFRGDGILARIVRRDHVPRATAQADLEPYIDGQLSSHAERGTVTRDFEEGMRRQVRSMRLAETFPAFSRVMSDAAGHLWVRRYDFPEEESPTPLWTVFDPGGTVLGFIETPKDLWIFEIGEDYLLGRTMDDLEVEKIQVWPLER